MPFEPVTLRSAAPRRGFFLTFEGLDGSGKTTQIQRLTTWLKERDLPLTMTRQPGGTPTGDRIRELLLDSKSSGLAPRAELAMMFADRAQTIQQVITPALESGHIVICDRFTDSTEAYQGGGRELGSEIVLALHRLICSDLQPDLTFLLQPALGASLNRARIRNTRSTAQTGSNENRFEREQNSFFHRVHAAYQQIARREPSRVVVIDGELTIQQVHQQVISTLTPWLEKVG